MQPEDWSRLKRGWPHLKKLDIPPPNNGTPIEAILGCVSMGLFEPLRPASVKGPGDPVAKWTPLGWMVGGRTRPQVDPVEEGLNHTHSGTILVVTITDNKEVSESRDQNIKSSWETVDPSDWLAGMGNGQQGCGGQCRQEYTELKNNMRRLWDLETEEEAGKLANTYFPSVRSQRQMEAETQLLRKLKQLPSGQYQAGLMWSGRQRPQTNWSEAKAAYLAWENRMEKNTHMKQAFHYAIQNWTEKDFMKRLLKIYGKKMNNIFLHVSWS